MEWVQEQQEQDGYIVVVDDQMAPLAVNEYGIPVVCAWCEPYVEGSTSTICEECREKYFPRRRVA